MAQPLFHSRAPIPSARRTAAQINPNVARMTGGEGLKAVGEAMFSVGLKIHQVNIARQVADAMAQYKLAGADFMASMINADPSKTDYNQKWGEFIASQGELSAGVSRDASAIIQNKLKMMQASDYKSLKRMEISNTRALVMNETPGVMDSLLREQVKAEMNGDLDRAEQAKENMVEYLQGVAPALRPGEGAKIIRLYDEALDKARTEEEAQRFAAQVLVDPVAAEKMINDGTLKYQTPKQLISLRTLARRQQGVKNNQSLMQKNAYLDAQSKGLMQQYFQGEALTIPEGVAPELQSTVDAINSNSSITNAGRDELPPEYYEFKEKVDRMAPIDDRALFYAAPMIPKEALRELDKINAENIKLRPRREEAKLIFNHIKRGFDKLIMTAIAMQFDETDTSSILMRELAKERDITLAKIRGRLLNGDTRVEIMTDLNSLFAATTDNVLNNRFWRKMPFVTGTNEFVGKLENTDDSRLRLQALMRLLMTGSWSDQIESAVQAGWIEE